MYYLLAEVIFLMFNRLAFRNTKRSIKDYFLYLITMIIICSLMFAFNSMIFSKDIMKLCSMAGIMAALIGIASVFIVVVVSWLINYMVRFMMEKKSKEFGIYLLMGMKKRQVSSLFIRENALIGVLAFFIGIVPGMFLQQVFTTIFYSIFGENYIIKIEFNIYSFLLTLVLYLGIYFFALLKNKKKLKKMTIRDMMDVAKENEEYSNKNEKLKVALFFITIIYFLIFDVILLTEKFTITSIWIFLGLLVLSIYLFYIGVSAIVVSYVKKDGESIYKKENLFLLRQFSSKIKTMEFTMATLTILFVFAILGGTTAMMFNDYLDKRLDYQLPFDIIIFSDNTNDDFNEYLNIIKENTKVKDKVIYNVYEDESKDINMFLRKELNYLKEDNDESNYSEFFDYDTYMKLSDYNKLRKMLGYEEASLSSKGFLIQCKDNTRAYLEKYFKNKNLNKGGLNLYLEGYYTDAFAQSGQNGADYIIVVPDDIGDSMKEYYSLVAVDIVGESPEGLHEKLSAVKEYFNNNGEFKCNITWGYGSDQIITCNDTVLVQSNQLEEIKFVLTAISFPLMYIGLVFLCVALTILSVQQVSDSSKYKYRYSVLSKLGLKEREIDKIILKQLLIYYLSPLIIAIGISSVLSIYISNKFVYYTSLNSSVLSYYGLSVFILLVVYIIYFVMTYVEFKRNIYGNN